MSTYSLHVFINCPFDDDYQPIFRAIVFTVFDCGFIPRTALEVSDADDIRIEKIIRIIRESRYSIHDISRTEQDTNTGLPRFNMPFEFGVYFGARHFGDKKQREKACLVMDTERYRYRNFISDISGQDIRAHHGKPEDAIKCVRDWLHEKLPQSAIPGSNAIRERYNRFNKELPSFCEGLKWDVHGLTFLEYITAVTGWLNTNSSRP